MDIELGQFEGREVQAAVAKFSGRTTQRMGKFAQEEVAYVVAKVKVNKVTHQDFTHQSGKDSARMFSRVHDMAVLNSYVLTADQGEEMMEHARSIADDTFGVQGLPFGTKAEEDANHDEQWNAALAAVQNEDAPEIPDPMWDEDEPPRDPDDSEPFNEPEPEQQ